MAVTIGYQYLAPDGVVYTTNQEYTIDFNSTTSSTTSSTSSSTTCIPPGQPRPIPWIDINIVKKLRDLYSKPKKIKLTKEEIYALNYEQTRKVGTLEDVFYKA